MTCGTDSDVRKWCNIDDDDPQALGTKNMNAIAVVSFVRIVCPQNYRLHNGIFMFAE
jgi:hypothetical protein